MNRNRPTALGMLMFSLLAIIILPGCRGSDMQPEKALKNFKELIEKGNADDLNLTVYYINPYILTSLPLSIEDLIDYSNVNEIIINGSSLEEHIDLLIKVSDATLIPVERASYLDARLCYIFETDNNGSVLVVAMDGVQIDNNGEPVDKCLYVNGHAVNENDVFYDVLRPFLTEEAKKDLEAYLGNN